MVYGHLQRYCYSGFAVNLSKRCMFVYGTSLLLSQNNEARFQFYHSGYANFDFCFVSKSIFVPKSAFGVDAFVVGGMVV